MQIEKMMHMKREQMMHMRRIALVLAITTTTLTGSALAEGGLSVDGSEQEFLDGFTGGEHEWVKVSNGIYTTQSNGSKTVVYRNEGVRTYLDELNRAIERQTTKMSNATDPDVLAANEKYLYALTQESAALEAELGKPRASTAKGVEIVEWDQPATCGFIIYANAEFAFWPNLVNSAYVTSSIDPIGSGPQFSSPPGPTRTYRHVRSEVDDPSLSAPAVEVATTRTNASTLSVTATHTNFWGDACVLTSTRTLRERRCVQWHRTGSGGEHPKLQRTVAIAWTPDHSAWSDPTSRSERRPE